MQLLLIEDDRSMQTALQRALSRHGIEVSICADGSGALEMWLQRQPDVVVLDLSLPGLDGLHVLERARRAGLRTPVLILTARGAVGDRVVGLNAGADDYLAKPFDLDELDARIRALLRRKGNAEENIQKCGDLRFEHSSGAFYCAEEALEFTPREHNLLKALIAKPGHAVTKERLFRLVFPLEENTQIEAIEVIVHRLRKKLIHTRTEIMTLRGLGYLLRVQPVAGA